VEDRLLPITVVKGRAGKPKRVWQHVGQPCRSEQRHHLAQRISGDQRLVNRRRRPAGARRLAGSLPEVGHQPLGALETKSENAAGQKTRFWPCTTNACGDAIPFFEGSRRGPFTDAAITSDPAAGTIAKLVDFARDRGTRRVLGFLSRRNCVARGSGFATITGSPRATDSAARGFPCCQGRASLQHRVIV
jgi:hypothetical protein